MMATMMTHWITYLIHQQNSKIEHNKGDFTLNYYIRWCLRVANYTLRTLLMLTTMTYHPLIIMSLIFGMFFGDFIFFVKSRAIYVVKAS